MNRDRMSGKIRERKEPWDLIVIGGGATGAGCCLDAASRGLSVLLLEQDDFGKGTSSRSTKLIHGGVRYLEQGNVPLVREALRERGILKNLANRYVFEQEFLLPCYTNLERIYFGAGLKFYDMLAGKRRFGKTRFLGRKKVIGRFAELRKDGIKGGIIYRDGRFDDTALLLAVLAKAASLGAVVSNYARVDSFIKSDTGMIEGVEYKCLESGETLTVRSRSVINATGVFVDDLREKSVSESKKLVRPSRGIHLVFDREFLDSDTALLIPRTKDGRVLFAIPFYERLLVGTTETSVENTELEPRAAEEEIDFILDACADYMTRPPKRSDIKSVFAGLRPLFAQNDSTNTSKLSRGHYIETDSSGLVTITGGKWTTFRNMAQDAVDTVIGNSDISSSESRTSQLELDVENEFDETGLERQLSPLFHWTLADVVRSIRFEMARTVEDILARRTRILFLDAREAIRVAPVTADLLAGELGKDRDWAEEEIERFNTVAAGYIADPQV